MREYLNLMSECKSKGIFIPDRTGVGTYSLVGRMLKFDLTNKFPLVTTKQLHVKSIIYELLWMLKGDTNIKYLKDNGVSIWDEWADENGDLGPIYGHQWRHWKTADGTSVDQISHLIDSLKNNPYSRRHILSAWNVGELDKMALPPCHSFVQFFVRDDIEGMYLHTHLTMRSADIFLGLPYNIASYAFLTYMLSHVLEYTPGSLTVSIGDAHIYKNHMDQVSIQLGRSPVDYPVTRLLPFNPDIKSIDDFSFSDFVIEGYRPHPHISAPVAV